MLSQYLKVALRSFARNKLYTFINIFALSVAMACGILAYVNDDYSRSFDSFHERIDNLYVFRSVSAADRGEMHVGITPRPLGPAVVQDVAQVERMTRVLFAYTPFKREDNVFNEGVYYVEPSFLDMFSFQVVSGSRESINDPSRIMLTRKTARKYFGDSEPVGNTISVRIGEDDIRDFIVGALLEDIPSASSIQFAALLPWTARTATPTEDQDWAAWSHETFVESSAPNAAALLEEAANRYVTHQNAANQDYPVSRFYVTPMADVAHLTRELSNDIFKEGMHPAAVFAPGITGILLLLTACFNFMNTSLAFAALRLKEVGIRKVLGSARRQLVTQFIGENLLLSAVALIIAIVLAEILVPAYSNLWPDWDYDISYAENWGLFAFFGSLLFGMSVFSGAYPSLYVSRLHPVEILKGGQMLRGKNWIVRSILTFQFALSSLTILTGIIFADNADFISKIDLGFDTQQTIVVPLQRTGSFEELRNRVTRDPRVAAAEGARHVPGYNQSTLNVRTDDHRQQVAVLSGGYQYFETLNMTLSQGRGFDEKFADDRDKSIIVSEKFVREFGIADPVGALVHVEDQPYTIVGVMKDVYNRSVWRPLQATAIVVCKPEEFRYVIFRTTFGEVKGVTQVITEAWKAVAPHIPYEGFYGTDAIAGPIEVSSNIRLVFIYVAGVAIAIASMGLFALSSLIIVRRTKEIGIRKVLGASVFSVMRLLNRQLVAILLLAALLAAVGGYFTLSIMLDSLFAYHIEPNGWHFVLAAGTILAIGLLTVSSQVYRLATGNPVESLRYE